MKRNDKGQFETEYDWPVLIPRICDQFISGVSLYNICAQPGYPHRDQVWRVIKNNPQYRESWRWALKAQMFLLDSVFDEIDEDCKEAATNGGGFNPLAMRIRLNIACLKYSNLERAYEKCVAVKRPWTGGVEQSLEEVLRAARKRVGAYRAKTQHG